jgi:hypothetical protein
MQKKKPPFQVIPNCGVNGFIDWNESKEVPSEQGSNDTGPHNFSDRCRSILRLIAIANCRGDIVDLNRIPVSSSENGAVQ